MSMQSGRAIEGDKASGDPYRAALTGLILIALFTYT